MMWVQTVWQLRARLFLLRKKLPLLVGWLALLLRKLLVLLVHWPPLVFNLRQRVVRFSVSSRTLLLPSARVSTNWNASLLYHRSHPNGLPLLRSTFPRLPFQHSLSGLGVLMMRAATLPKP